MNNGGFGPPARPKTRHAGSGAALFASARHSACCPIVDNVIISAGVNLLPNVASISAARVVAVNESPPSAKKSSKTLTTSIPNTSCQISVSLRSASVWGSFHSVESARSHRRILASDSSRLECVLCCCLLPATSVCSATRLSLYPALQHKTADVWRSARRLMASCRFCLVSVVNMQHFETRLHEIALGQTVCSPKGFGRYLAIVDGFGRARTPSMIDWMTRAAAAPLTSSCFANTRCTRICGSSPSQG